MARLASTDLFEVAPIMKFTVLGPVRAWRGGTELDLGSPQQRAVLALLLVRAGTPVPLHEIVRVLWAENAPDTAVNIVHRHIGALRRVFEPELPTRRASRWLIRSSGGYRLEVDPEGVDLMRFRRLRDEAADLARQGKPGAAAEMLLEALALWIGPVAAGIPHEIRSYPVFTAVDGEQLSALKSAAEYAPAAGPAVLDRVLSAVRQAAAQHPLDELLQARLMVLLAVTGRQAEALDVYRSARATLADELGLDPGPDLRAAHQQVLRQITPATDLDGGGAAEGEAGPAVRPAQLPADLAVFAGRRHELDQFRTLLAGPADERPASVVTIGGMAGVGKTTLAVHLAHRVAHEYPDGQLYIDLHGFHPGGAVTSCAEAMHSFLEALGVPSGRVPASLEAQAALFRSLLAGRRYLLVLDNARDSDHVRPLLPGSSGCLTIVTSRHQLYDLVTAHGATAVTLGLLPYAEATELMSRRLGADRIALEPRAAEDIIELSGRLPLTLAIISARATMNPGFSLTSIAEEMRRTEGSLEAFAGESPRSDARSVFAWSYRILGPSAARVFRLMATHPGPDCSLTATAALTAQSPMELRPLLAELLRAHLITETAPGRFGCHDLLRVYGAELAARPEHAADVAEARRRLFDHYLHSTLAATGVLFTSHDELARQPPVTGADPARFRDASDAVAWLEAEHAVLTLAIEQDAREGDGRYGWQLATMLERHLDRTGRWLVQLDIQTRARQAADRTGDRHAMAITARSLGHVCGRLGRRAEADRNLAEALELFDAVGDRNGRAFTHRYLAFQANQRGCHDDALEHYRTASDLYRSTGWLSGQASVRNEVGWTYILMGDHAKALDECRRAIEGHRQIGDRNGEAAAWDSLGYAQHHLHAYNEALVSFEHALRLYRALRDRYLEADTLVHVGDTRHAIAGSGSAAAEWEQALDILDELGHPDADQVRDRLRGVGAGLPS
jgi:DNA-binding SARP family transcriptional activator/tetratricopeptide (TPR) repeat protein